MLVRPTYCLATEAAVSKSLEMVIYALLEMSQKWRCVDTCRFANRVTQIGAGVGPEL